MNGLGGSRTPDGDEVPAEPEGRRDNQSPPSVTLQQRKLQEQRTPATPDVRLYHRAVVVAQEATGAAPARAPARCLSQGHALSCGTAQSHCEAPHPVNLHVCPVWPANCGCLCVGASYAARLRNGAWQIAAASGARDYVGGTGRGAAMLSGASSCAGSLRGLVRQLSIDQFENESRRVSCDSSKAFSTHTPGSGGTPMFEPSGAAAGQCTVCAAQSCQHVNLSSKIGSAASTCAMCARMHTMGAITVGGYTRAIIRTWRAQLALAPSAVAQ